MKHNKYYSTLTQAIVELGLRRKDPNLRRRVEEYMKGDIPKHFDDGPILYLARHVATPNQETRAFLELCEHLDFKAVIGQDPEDVFVSHNSLKRSLGKIPILKGVAHNGEEILEYVTVLDFNKAQGKRLSKLRTFSGTPLIEFHNELFDHVHGKRPIIQNESKWINRQHRGNLLEHYKRHLALFVVHGILFEYFLTMDTEEQRLVAEIIAPAYDHVRETFGVGPLITPPVSPSVDQRNWESYPRKALEIVRAHTKPK